jgi:cytochrome c oxidase subunit 2
MISRKWIVFILIFIPFSFLTALDTEDEMSAGGTADGRMMESDDTAEMNELIIHAYNWGFEFNDYEIKAGQPVKIILIIDEGHHGIRIDGFGLKTGNYRTGETDEFIVQVPEAGEYEIRCSVYCGSGHRTMSDVIRVVD